MKKVKGVIIIILVTMISTIFVYCKLFNKSENNNIKIEFIDIKENLLGYNDVSNYFISLALESNVDDPKENVTVGVKLINNYKLADQNISYLYSEQYSVDRFIDKTIEYLMSEDYKKPQISKYNSVYPGGSSTTPGGWCTEYVTWGLVQAEKELGTNYLDNLFAYEDSGYRAAMLFYKKKDRLHTEEDYIPKRGDFMFFQYYDRIIDHTAFVLGVEEEDGTIYVLTIEGNIPSLTDKSIKERKIPLNDKNIYGYGSYK